MGRLYAGSPFVENPLKNAARPHAKLGWFPRNSRYLRGTVSVVARFAPDIRTGWLAAFSTRLATGLRSFRDTTSFCCSLVLMAARGFTLIGRKRELVALLCSSRDTIRSAYLTP